MQKSRRNLIFCGLTSESSFSADFIGIIPAQLASGAAPDIVVVSDHSEEFDVSLATILAASRNEFHRTVAANAAGLSR
jgi:hypothetical protein